MYLITTAINAIYAATTIEQIDGIVEEFELDLYCNLAEEHRDCGPDDQDDLENHELHAELESQTLQGYAALRKNMLNNAALAACEFFEDTEGLIAHDDIPF